MTFLRRLLLGMLVAAVALLGIEGGLRLLGVAAPQPFFHEQRDRDGRLWMVSNPSVGDNWFHGAEWEDLVRRPRYERFEADKPDGTFRVFVLGESSAYGTPLDDNATWATQLEFLLGASQDQWRVEVINVALRAVSADIYLDVLPELHRYQPDLLVLYAGHNEYYGVRRQRFLRSLRLFRALQAAGDPGRVTVSETEQIGLQAEVQVPGGGERERAVAQRFGHTLDDLVDAARGVPLMVYLTYANERHMAPLCSSDGGADVAVVAQADSLLVRAAADPAALSAKDCALAATEAIPAHAGLHWVQGWCAQGRGDLSAARAAFRRSIDLDCLPVRARSSQLEQARGLAARHPGAPVLVVDPEPALTSAEPSLALGHEVLYDHVHLSILGSYLLARRGAEALAEHADMVGLPVRPDDIPGYGEARQALHISLVDDLLNLERMVGFYERSIVQHVATRQLSVALFQREGDALAEVFDEVTTEVLEAEPSGATQVWPKLAERYDRLGDTTLALECSRRAVLAAPDCGRCHKDLALRLAAMGQREAAREHALAALMLAIPERDLAPALR